MAEIAVSVEGLGKRFRIGRAASYWALRDVGFEVRRGEALGIVGRNGAGKSTLLKILSRITPPSRGRAEIRGRVGSLLEVGTGFHPELTGRENVFLNGAILGMRRAEVRARFDEIAAFSGVETFLDTPVKRFSSGMRMRLAFAVAAHLEPEILIVDEVLAVGDEEFQRKCLGKMGDVTGAGRTVLFVSHNLSALRALCESAVYLEQGCVAAQGVCGEVIDRYLASARERGAIALDLRRDRVGSGRLRLTRLRVLAGDKLAADARPASGEPLAVALRYEAAAGAPLASVRAALTFFDAREHRLFTCDTRFVNADFGRLPGSGELVCEIPVLPLAAGRYQIDVWTTVADEVADYVRGAAHFSVCDGDFFGTGRTAIAEKNGPYLVGHAWRHAAQPADGGA